MQAAQTLQEIHILLDGASLEGIKIVDEQRGFVQQVRYHQHRECLNYDF